MAFDVDERIAELEEKILDARVKVDDLEATIAQQEERLAREYRPVERYIIRGVIKSLQESIARHLGWMRRWERQIEELRELPPPPPPIVYTCPECGEEFDSKEELDDHMETEHPPPPPEYLITDEDYDGNLIYRVPDLGIYRVRDEAGNLIREVRSIVIEYVASIDTNRGHDVPLTVELTATTSVRNMTRADITRVEAQMESGVWRWARENGLGAVRRRIIKVGVDYSDEDRAGAIFGVMPPDYPTAHLDVEKTSPRSRRYDADIQL